MPQGFEFELSNGTVLQIVPKAGYDNCAISHGDTKIEINVNNSSFQVIAPANKLLMAIPSVVRFEAKELTVNNTYSGSKKTTSPHIMTNCMDCNGQSCCITNGCGNCGCGWICD